MDTLTYSRPIDPASADLVYGPDAFGCFYALARSEVLDDGRARATFRPLTGDERAALDLLAAATA